MDLKLLTWFAASDAPFAMECAQRTEADKKVHPNPNPNPNPYPKPKPKPKPNPSPNPSPSPSPNPNQGGHLANGSQGLLLRESAQVER